MAFDAAERNGLEVCDEHDRLADEVLGLIPVLDAGYDRTLLIAERNRLLTMVDAIRKLEKKFSGTDLGDELKAIIKNHVHTRPLTLKALGITSPHIAETEEPEEEEEE